MNNKRSLLALSIIFASSSSLAMQALDDDSMQDITGQGGITIEQTSLGENGFVSGTGEISFTQKDYEGTGDVTLTIDGTETYMYSIDEVTGERYNTTITRTIDIDEDGNLSIKTFNIDKMDTRTGAMAINGKKLNGGSEINVWEYAPGSYLETFVENNSEGAKIKSRTFMTEGSGYSQRAFANGITTASDVAYFSADGGSEPEPFMTELILASDKEGGLRLEFGETRGTIEIQNLRLFDSKTGENVHEAGKFEGDADQGLAYYDTGYGNIEVNSGYMTIRAAGNNVNGLEGEMASDINIGQVFIRTKDASGSNKQQFNINNASFVVDGEIGYDLKLKDFGRAGSIEAQLVSKDTTADIVLGQLTFSNDTGYESANMASIAVKEFSLEGGTLDIGMYGFAAGEKGSPFEDDVSVMQTVSADRASFKLTVAGEDISDPKNDGQPIVQGDVVINNYSSEQFVSNTKRGMETVSNSSYSMSINALRAGNGQHSAGQSGRLVINNYQQINAHTIIEPLSN